MLKTGRFLAIVTVAAAATLGGLAAWAAPMTSPVAPPQGGSLVTNAGYSCWWGARVQILPGLPRRLLRRRMLHGKKILQEAGLLLLAFARRFRLSTLASCSDAQTPGFVPGVCLC